MKKASYVFSLLLLFIVTLHQPAQAQTRRWSPQAKDATIGAGIGGVAGAIINKRNRVVGGVIGGVVGGAAGYAIGKHTDNKNKEAARVAAAREAERRATAEREALAARKEATSREEAALAREEAASREAAADRREAASRETAANVPAGRSTVATQPDAAPVQTAVLSAASPSPSLSLGVAAGPALDLHPYYLPNLSYGDASAPYGMSKYRRKSW